tara:strand:- start:392 stop:1207 length:816 start_codon:yes stop_codon:yes gene_type:complete
MPELPEVETTRAGIALHILNMEVESVVIRQPSLRWPVPSQLNARLKGVHIREVLRRGKYLLLRTEPGTVIIHLGMSGSLRILKSAEAPEKHDHVDIVFKGSVILRYTDPRRFGCVLWTEDEPHSHKLLSALGPEPLTDLFGEEYLFAKSRGRSVPVKSFIMDSKVVVGVGNIYANEALFRAGIRPLQSSGRISKQRYARLTSAIKRVLQDAISKGGTTLRDFVDGDGQPGYFAQQLDVYGRAGQPCNRCGNLLKELRLAQRATVYCASCQH